MYALPLLAAAGGALKAIGGGSAAMGAMNVASTGTMAGGMIQGVQGMKQAEQHQAQNLKMQKQQMRVEQQKVDALNNLANSPAGQTVQGQAVQQGLFSTGVLKNQKLFAAGIGMKDVTGFVKDVYGHVKKNKKTVGGFLAFGAAMPVGKYIADRAVQTDKSVMPKEERSYSNSTSSPKPKGKGNSIMGSIMGPGIAVGVGALSVVGSYIGDKASQKRVKDKTKDSIARQKTYSAAPSLFGRIKNSIKRSYWGNKQNMDYINSINKPNKDRWWSPKDWVWLKKVKHNPLRGAANVYNSFNMMGGETGMQSFKNSLVGKGSSGSKISKKIANFMDNHGATSMAAIGAIGGGALFKASDLVDKGVESGIRKLDKNAYKYTDSKEKEMN